MSNPLSCLGKAAADVLKIADSLFSAPAENMEHAVERLNAWATEAVEQTPPERRVKAPGNIVASAAEAIRFEDDSSELKQNFIRLLASCIDSERQSKVHPAFPEMLRQMSPNDAALLQLMPEFGDSAFTWQVEGTQLDSIFIRKSGMGEDNGYPLGFYDFKEIPSLSITLDFENLERLGIIQSLPLPHIEILDVLFEYFLERFASGDFMREFFGLTYFGQSLVDCCVPKKASQFVAHRPARQLEGIRKSSARKSLANPSDRP